MPHRRVFVKPCHYLFDDRMADDWGRGAAFGRKRLKGKNFFSWDIKKITRNVMDHAGIAQAKSNQTGNIRFLLNFFLFTSVQLYVRLNVLLAMNNIPIFESGGLLILHPIPFCHDNMSINFNGFFFREMY